jgi:hypothetical protein
MPVSINGTNGLTFNDGTVQNTVGYSPWRNRIINGDMRIDQRNNGASVTITNTGAVTYTLDRWAAFGSNASRFSVQQNAGAVTPPAGFANYLGVTSLSAYTVGAAENFTLTQNIEGFNTADLGWGTASAQTVTLSFWVRSSLTGTFGGAFINSAVNRSYPFTYAISAANTWEQKTVVIAGDTSGTWVTNNGVGIRCVFGLGVGSSGSGTPGAWAGSLFQSATGATSVVGTNGATFYITGVQLEAGTTATPFERVEFGESLRRCQRYCIAQTGAQLLPARGTGTTSVQAGFTTPVAMRAAPSITASVAATVYAISGASIATATLSVATFYSTGIQIGAAGLSGVSDDRAASLSITGAFVLSAEL